jgi:predicted site-specific integrase-resolvase
MFSSLPGFQYMVRSPFVPHDSTSIVTHPRVAIYCRVSTAAQEDNSSLETQETRCRDYATKQG